MIYRYIYMIVCMKGSYKYKFYIGQHTTKNLDDGYKGSGTLIKKYYKKYPNDYIKSIICYCDSKEQLDQREKECIEQYINHQDCLNIAEGGHGGFTGKRSEESKKKMSESRIGKHYPNLSFAMQGRTSPNKGKKLKSLTEDAKLKISNHWKTYGHPKGMLGNHHSDETKLKISLSCKGKTGNKGIDNPTYKTKWMTDGYDTVRVKQNNWGDYIDIGFRFGRI